MIWIISEDPTLWSARTDEARYEWEYRGGSTAWLTFRATVGERRVRCARDTFPFPACPPARGWQRVD